MSIFHGLLRAIAVVLTLLITALIGNVIANNINASSSATKAINFTIFVAAWSWITALYGIVAAFVPSLFFTFLILPLDILAVLLTFIDAIVLSAKLRAIDCGNIDANNLPSSWIAFGSSNNEKRCREIQASLVFMWFLFATFCGCLFFAFTQSRGGLGFGRPFKKSSQAKPSMSQVGA
ncbi:hypothetical protein N3K66_004606 [Trichothecium roseum]|uniref:Uncharacterized protein n=1 Tax=Trichothecium roseum TaxID=47278 RepID=A0ACC0V1R5_9HYPO|nr:hypothetical protein N3K66_004606 [Trichothecium roseum]